MTDQPTTGDILEAIHAFSENVDKRFEKVEEEFKVVHQKIQQSEHRVMDYVDRRMGALEEKLLLRSSQR